MIADKLLSFTLMGAGWVLWLLVGLSVLSVTVIVERGVYFWRRRMSHRFPRLLALAQAGDLADAGEIAEGDSMEAEVARVAGLRSRNHEQVAEAISSVIEKRRLSYEQGLFILGTLGNNAPFVGLFGTVLGIIRAFADLAVTGKGAGGAASVVMAGISEALVATAVGLFVAIPAVLAFNVFQRLLKRVTGRSQALAHAVAAGMHAKREVA